MTRAKSPTQAPNPTRAPGHGPGHAPGPGGAPGVTREGLFQMLAAYKTTSLLCGGIELGVFDALADGPAGAGAVAGRLGLDPRATRILLNALAALRLLDSDGHGYALAPGADALLVRGRPGYLGDMAKVLASGWEWDALKHLPEAVRHGGTVAPEHAETAEFAYWEDFAAFAGAIAVPTAELAAKAVGDWAAARDPLHVLDVACGHGLYGFTLARTQPHARVWALDWGNVLPLAKQHAQRLGVLDRVELIAGDMFEAPLGGPYDLAMLTNVLHHFSPERGTELLSRLAGTLRPGGRVLLVGFAVDDGPPAGDPTPHLFSILMLVWTHQGEVHTVATYERMLAASGFAPPTAHRVPGLPMRVLVADRAG